MPYYLGPNATMIRNAGQVETYGAEVGARWKISAYWIANLQLGYNFKWGRATLFAQNLFDSDKRLLVPDNNVNSAIYQRPRMIGATFELKF